MALLENSLDLHSCSEEERPHVKNFLKHYALFSIYLFRRMQLINHEGRLNGFARFAVSLGNFEPGNLLFIHVLQTGCFHRLIKQRLDAEVTSDAINEELVFILAHIFTNLPISNSLTESLKATDEKPYLAPLSEDFQKAVSEYNNMVNEYIFNAVRLASEDGHVFVSTVCVIMLRICKFTFRTLHSMLLVNLLNLMKFQHIIWFHPSKKISN